MTRVYYTIGDAGGNQYPNYWADIAKVDQDLRLCMWFLIERYGSPPAGSELEIIAVTYHNDFHIISLGFDEENVPEGAFEYSRRLDMALEEFVEAIDWMRIQPAAIESVIARKRRNNASISGKPHPANAEAQITPE